MTIEAFRDVSAIDPIAVSALRRHMRGELLTPDTAGYATAYSGPCAAAAATSGW